MRKLVLILMPCLALLIGCPQQTPEQDARDTLAAGSGYIKTAQAQHKAECQADPTKNKCQLINRAIDGENATITALETYCGYVLAPALPPPETVCAPVTTAQAGLLAATANLRKLLTDVKGLTK